MPYSFIPDSFLFIYTKFIYDFYLVPPFSIGTFLFSEIYFLFSKIHPSNVP